MDRCHSIRFTAAICGLLLSLAPVTGRAKDFNLKLNLDAFLAQPELWKVTPDDVAGNFKAEGFNENPYFNWDKEGQNIATFSRKPYNNVTVDLRALAEKAPLEEARLEFKDGRLARVVLVVARPLGTRNFTQDDVAGYRASCESALNAMLGAAPVRQARSFGAAAEANVESLVWSSAKGVACLDASPRDRVLRFMLAPAGTPLAPLTARPVEELFAGGGTSFFVNLDSFLAGGVWGWSPDQVDEMFQVSGFKETPFFKWLTQSREGARFSRKPYSNVTVELSIFGGRLKPEEAVIEFKDGRASAVNVSLYNRGDGGQIDAAEFDARYKTAGRALGETLKVSPRERRPTAQTAVKTTGWLWTAPETLALLEFNSDAMDKKGRPEFLRLKLSPPAGRDRLLGIAAVGRGVTTLKPSELLQFVKKDPGGDVFVNGIPMVDQGDKGYCVVASCQRMFGYLHVQCDQHELASLAGSDADRGTSSVAFVAALSKIGSRFKVHFKPLLQKRPGEVDKTMKPEKFAKLVQDHVNLGLPLLWSLELGRYKEEPQSALQSGGGHMRLIIGYNTAKEQLLFSDSWGAGHELKRMNLPDALKATTGVFLVEPQVRL